MREPVKMLALTAFFSALTAVGAFIRIPTPWMAITLQTFFVLLSGILLGPKYGALSQIVYVALGLIGLPVFTEGGGFSYVLKPSFGFTLGFIASSFVTGLLMKKSRSFFRLLLACLAGHVTIYLIGLPYMAAVLNLYLKAEMSFLNLLMAGLVPFLLGDAVKILLAALVSGPLIKLLSRIAPAS